MKLYNYCLTILLIACIYLNSAVSQTHPQEITTLLDQWVETKRIISEERSNWEIEESLLFDTQELLSSELERLKTELDDLEATSTASDEERASLSSEKEDLKKASEVVASSIGNLEKKLIKILPILPEPLLEKINPLIRRMPNDSDNTDLSLGQRVQNIVGILSQTDKFNTTITAKREIKAFEEGKSVQVTTLYWGLAMAYYVDDSGKYAGIGIPTKEGWAWPLVDGIAREIKTLVEIYEGTGEIRFIKAPAKIHTL